MPAPMSLPGVGWVAWKQVPSRGGYACSQVPSRGVDIPEVSILGVKQVYLPPERYTSSTDI